MPTLEAVRLDLRATLESGQFFRWRPDGDRFILVLGDRLVRLHPRGDRLHYEGTRAAPLRRFLALDVDLPRIEAALERDPLLRPVIRATRGLRLLRQDPWECAVAFLTSMVSNIPRITRNLEAVARDAGRPIRLNGLTDHAFPSPDDLPGEARLRRLGFGFRAKYIAALPRHAGVLDSVRGLPYDEAKKQLKELPGMGEKVADCVLLFAYGIGEAFPVDTWIRKVMIRRFFRGRRRPDRDIAAFARDRWGPLAGHAQQALFARARAQGTPTSSRS